MIDDLASLVAPLSESEFIRHFVAKERLFVKTHQAERAACLFPWPTINSLIASDIVPPQHFSVLCRSTEVPSHMYRRSDTNREIRAEALHKLAAQGISVRIDQLERFVPQVASLSDALARRLGHDINVNTYLSFTRDSAFKAHFDLHDVCILQVHGRKRWRSYGTFIPFPLSFQSAEQHDVIWEDTLEPGDLLYIPRGEVHEATVEGPHSVHLTIGIKTRTGVDLVKWLGKRAEEEVLFRMDLTRLGGLPALHEHEALLKRQLHELVEELSVAAYLEADDAKRLPRPALCLGPNLLPVPEMVLEPVLRRVIALPGEGGDDVAVMIGGEKVRLSAAARAVFSFLLERGKSTFVDMSMAIGTNVTESALHEAVRELARKGLIRSPSSGS